MKLVYFDIKGLAEVSRYILALNKVEYEDFRYPFKIENKEYKHEQFDSDKSNGLLTKSMNKLPFLVLDSGTIICQSKSIERFLARKYNLLGSSEEEAAKIDSICECIRDFKEAYNNIKIKNDPEKINEYFNKIFPEQILNLVKLFDNQNKKHCISNNLSLADITLYAFINDYFKGKSDKQIDIKSIQILNIISNVEFLLQDYLIKRIDTMF